MTNRNTKRVTAIAVTLSGLFIAYTAVNNIQLNVSAKAMASDCIRDNVTQLTWDMGPTANVTHYQAANFIQKLNASRWCGFNDWRLPSLVELQELDGAWTTTETGLVWSKTLATPDRTRAWVVDFSQNKTITQPLTHTAAVRLVRGHVIGERIWQLNSGRRVRANGAFAFPVVRNAKPTADSNNQILKAAGTWSTAGAMSVTRNDHTATRLPNGQILIAGGYNDATGGYLNSAELFNPSTNAWVSLSPMAVARQFHTATLLKNGKVLVVGGANDDEGFLASAELFSPSTSTWSNASTMPMARAGHTASLLSNGKVIVAGGFNNGNYLNTAILYEPATQTWSNTSNMVAATSGHTATLLQTGKILIAGGCNTTICGLDTAQLYNPDVGTWRAAATMATARSLQAATILDDGTVLVSGGYLEQFSTHLKSAERYNPSTDTWSATGDMVTESQNHSLTLLPQGQVLVAGGETNSTFSSTRAELYDSATETFSAIVPMSSGRDTNTATWLVNSCQVLVTGGFVSANAEVYSPDTVCAVVTPVAGLTTTEAVGSGHTAIFTVKLAAAPAGAVTIDLFSTDLTEGTVAPASLNFTVADWDVIQDVTVTGVNDGITDGNVAYSIIGSFTGVNLLDVAVSNIDDDVRAVVITPTSGLVTTEAGGTASFSVKLGNQPSGDVTIGLSSSDSTEGTVAPAVLTFTTVNWNAVQTATVTGVDDNIADGNIAYTVVTTVGGGGYAGINAPDVLVTNTDNDSRGVDVVPTSGLVTTEDGGTATFSVKLKSQPTANVVIGAVSSDTTEGIAAPAALTFTPVNWNTAQVVTVSGVDDASDDGSVAYSVVTTATGGDYANFAVDDVGVSNIDNDAKGLTVVPVDGLVTTEAGGSATFSVKLNTRPTANVTVGLSSSDASEGTVVPLSLIFTADSWNIAQTVTVSGVNDNLVDGNIGYTIRTAAAVGGDYAGVNGPDVAVVNNDNDSNLVIVSALSGTNVTEAAGAARTRSFTVKLAAEPTAPVSIGLSSSDLTEGTVSPATLYFTTANYNIAQTVTVTAVDDSIDDGDVTFSVVTAPAVGGNFAGANAVDVAVVNTDDDTRGATIVPSTGLVTSESGGIANFSVRLNTQPTADVTIGLSSSDATEGTVAPSSLTFTTVNWSTAQVVTVSGVDDVMVDGDVAYSVVTAVAFGGDYGTASFNAVDVSVTNDDDDSRGIAVTLPTGLTSLTLTEANTTTTATFTVKLNTVPATNTNVVIGLTSSDTSEGTVSPSSLTFTTANWATVQSVTVTRVNDSVDDGDVAFNIVTAAAVSSDVNYSGIDAADVAVVTTDDDVRGISVSPIAGLVTTESGGTATFTVKLNSQPTADVTIPISSSGITEGTVAPTSLTFTPSNWNTAQTVTVTGVADGVDDGNVLYAIVTAPAVGGDYLNVNAANVSVRNTDVNDRGVVVSSISGNTTEGGGAATFSVKLDSKPTADVIIAITSSDITEGVVSPVSLTFTPTNAGNLVNGAWVGTPKTVTVTGVADNLDDGNVTFSIVTGAVTGVSDYVGINPADVAVVNVDNDTGGVTVSGISGNTSEAGGIATFTVHLNTQPTGDVSIALSSADITEGTVSPASLTFTPSNYTTNQTVTVRGVNDFVDDGDVTYTVVTGVPSGGGYNGVDTANVTVVNVDNDTRGATVVPITGLVTTEAGGRATFTVKLNSQPTANVVIGLSTADTSEGTVAPASLTFNVVNWASPQLVTVTGVDDSVKDGGVVYTITTGGASGGDYANVTVDNVSVTNLDDSDTTPIIIVNPVSGLITTEAGGTATFTVKLGIQPTADVAIGFTSSDASEGTVAPASLTFKNNDWNSAKTVTVTGVNDSIEDGDIAFNAMLLAASSNDLIYKNVNAPDVSVTNIDNDIRGVTVSAISGATTEASGTATFTVKLNSQPTGNVVIGLSSSDTTEGSVSPTSLTFTTANWNTAQTVTVTGVNDDVDDGDIVYTIVIAAATGGGYDGFDAPNVAVTNTDNDTRGITVSAISGATTEAGVAKTFTVKLNSQPTADVSIGLSSSDTTEGTVSPASLTFTTANWATAQTVTVTGVNDDIDDGDIAYTIVIAAATGGDYAGVDATNVTVTNTDNDTRGITVTPTSGLVTTEALGTATFTVKLNTQPTANVSIGLSSSDSTEGTVSPTSLTFTTANWATAQTVTVTGVNDDIDDGDIAYSIVTAVATGGDYGTAGVDAANVLVTNTDNDQTITFGTAPTGLVVAGTKTVSATANSGLPVTFTSTTTGVCTVSGSTVTGVTAGTCTIAANQAGNANYDAAPQVTQNITVGKGSQTITFGTAPTVVVGDTGTVSATATSGLAVTFTSATTGICTVTGSTVTGVAVGTCTINANQAGDANYIAATTVTQSFTVGKGSQTITFGAAPTGLAVDGTKTVSATTTSGLTATFTSNTASICTVSGSTVTGQTVGTCIIAAAQAGDANYNPATTVTQSIAVGKGSQTITFGAAPSMVFGGTAGTVSATATSGLAVTFSSTTTSVCTVSGSAVTAVTAGNCIVAANQAGNANYNPAPQVTQTITIYLFSNGFETTDANWSQLDVTGTNGAWSSVASSANPTASPHGGAMLANFNSDSATSGDKTRFYRSTGFAIASSYSTVTLKFWMYHDNASSTKNDNVQVQVSNNGSTWTSVGSAVSRYSATNGWTQATVDISTYKGTTVYLGFLGTSARGNNMSIDDITVTVP